MLAPLTVITKQQQHQSVCHGLRLESSGEIVLTPGKGRPERGA